MPRGSEEFAPVLARALSSSGIVRPGPAVVEALDELTRLLDEAAKGAP